MFLIRLGNQELYLETFEDKENLSFTDDKASAMEFKNRKEASKFMTDRFINPNLHKIVPRENG